MNGTKKIRNGAAVFCNDEEDREKLKKVLENKLGDNFKIEGPHIWMVWMEEMFHK